MDQSPQKYIFYDGPPFATGTPHYGHILNGFIKDAQCRLMASKGYIVDRQFGWDCHGLPVEHIIDRQIPPGVTLSIKEYNSLCRKKVESCYGPWKVVTEKMDRWIDIDKSYKTMDVDYMKRVCTIFKYIWDQGLVYRDYKIMPYSCACGTTLSNSDSTSNYKMVKDKCATVRFKLCTEEGDVYMLAWTTTIWTLPANSALCVNPDSLYVTFLKDGDIYVMAEDLYKEEYPVINKYDGRYFIGKKYAGIDGTYYPVVGDGFVQTSGAEVGTGIVHIAPGYGEDDYRLAKKYGLKIIAHVDDEGRLPGYNNLFFKAAESCVIKDLKSQGYIYSTGTVEHRYPHCWRSNTPLMYKLAPSWFIRTTVIKDQLLKNANTINWTPNHVSFRFINLILDGSDWAISRTRKWGCPIPIWVNKEGHYKCDVDAFEGMGDIHREHVDDIVLEGGYRRIPDVFDCWFESGAMPYATLPYSNIEDLLSNWQPADFIAEGVDQTRGWFMSLLVISTICSERAPFKNVTASGIILAADGKKMSKSLQNYTDPTIIMNKYSPDALRLYLLGSPAANNASEICFKDKEVSSAQKIINMVNAAYHFWKEYSEEGHGPEPNEFDHWILSRIETCSVYNIKSVVNDLNNVYIRHNKTRFKHRDKEILGYVLKTFGLKVNHLMPITTKPLIIILDTNIGIIDPIDEDMAGKVPEFLSAVEYARGLKNGGSITLTIPDSLWWAKEYLQREFKVPECNIRRSDSFNVEYGPVSKPLGLLSMEESLNREINMLKKKHGVLPKDNVKVYINEDPPLGALILVKENDIYLVSE